MLRTPAVQQAGQYECAEHLAELEAEFGADILQRSAVWLTIKESRASFAIEHEEQHVDRVRRFAAAIEHWCGRHEDPLSEAALEALQAEILGPRATRYGVRRSPVLVGEVDGFREVVRYIAPHWNDAPQLLSGLRDCAARTAGGSALVRAAVLSFGFVYIHPMSDGNGRISRFLHGIAPAAAPTLGNLGHCGSGAKPACATSRRQSYAVRTSSSARSRSRAVAQCDKWVQKG